MSGLKQRFPKKNRLLTRQEFRRVSFHGTRLTGKYLILDVLEVPNSCRKLGITVTKKYGNSVHRNRFKRCVREAFRLNKLEIPKHVWMIARPRRFALKGNTCLIAQDMLSLLYEKSENIPTERPKS